MSWSEEELAIMTAQLPKGYTMAFYPDKVMIWKDRRDKTKFPKTMEVNGVQIPVETVNAVHIRVNDPGPGPKLGPDDE